MMQFYSEQVTGSIRRIWSMPAVCMYLVEGSEKALLIDTGCGEKGLREYVERILQGKSYDVLLTHGHVDHASGASAFEHVWLHPADSRLVWRHCTLENRFAYWEHCKPMLGEIPLPEASDFVPLTQKTFSSLTDRQIFDLGDRTVQVFHVPGHTQGTMVPFLLEEEIAFFGDACGTGTLLAGQESTTVQEYYQSLLRLRQDAPPFSRVLRQHGTFVSEPSILTENIDVCEHILSGTDDAVPHRFMGQPCLRAMRTDPMTRKRIDGKEGNIVYRADRIR